MVKPSTLILFVKLGSDRFNVEPFLVSGKEWNFIKLFLLDGWCLKKGESLLLGKDSTSFLMRRCICGFFLLGVLFLSINFGSSNLICCWFWCCISGPSFKCTTKGTPVARNNRIGIMCLGRIILYFCRVAVEGGAGSTWRLISSSGWPLADSESGVDSRFGVVVYGSVALVLVFGFGGGGVCGKIRRFKGLLGEDDWREDERDADGREEVIMAHWHWQHVVAEQHTWDERCVLFIGCIQMNWNQNFEKGKSWETPPNVAPTFTHRQSLTSTHFEIAFRFQYFSVINSSSRLSLSSNHPIHDHPSSLNFHSQPKTPSMRSGSDGWFEWLQRKETNLQKHSATTSSAQKRSIVCTSTNIDCYKDMIIL